MSNHESSLQPKIQRFENLKNKRTEVVKNIIVVKQIQYNFYDRKIRHYICRLTYYKKSRSIMNSTETYLATLQYLFTYSKVVAAVNFLLLQLEKLTGTLKENLL